MDIITEAFSIRTTTRNQMIDITPEVAGIIQRNTIENGLVTIYCPHTTAGITINENADPDVMHDIMLTLSELLPKNRKGYLHGEGNSDSHVKASLIGASETIPFKSSRMLLGTWQGVMFCEFDGPRNRKVTVQIQGP